jgi:tetratricopeptide (TPR) repeat protein
MVQDPWIGKEIGNYQIISLINSGAFGSVYKAEHLHLKERITAIKFLHAYMAPTEHVHFVQEAQFLSSLEHRYILPLIDFGFDGGLPYLIAKYAVGGSLRDRLLHQLPLSTEQAVTILSHIGQALQYAHTSHIIHRDLKPENILFNAQGEALLADFGIATVLSSTSVKRSAIIGTPSYMAPEQFRGMVSKESDQYALGCIAYELFTGHKPFTAPDFIAMGFKHATEPPISPRQLNAQVLPGCEAAILKALAKQRADRHASVEVFLTALRESFIRPTVVVLPAPTRTKEEWLKIGNDHSHAQRYEEAIVAYDQAIRLDPNYVFAYTNKGDALNGLKRYEEAIAACDQALRLDPNDAIAYDNKGYALNGLKRYQEAIVALDQAIRRDPNDAFAYAKKGYALNELERYQEAIVALDQALRRDPNDAIAYDNKGRALNELKRYEEAIAVCDQAIRLDPNDAFAYAKKGYALNYLKRYQEAIAVCDQAIRRDPNYAYAYDRKGYALNGLKRYQEAIAVCDQALRLDPNDAIAYDNKGYALEQLGRHREAQQVYRRAKALR